MIFSGLENIGNEKRDNQKVVSSLFGSLNRLKMDFTLSGVSDVLMDFSQNAAGQKISKFVSAVNTNNEVKLVEYLDGFQYTGEELNFFPHPEGYVNVTLGTTGNRIFNYVYYYTDHLGNIRLIYTKDMVSNQLKIMDENHYYPFGLKHQKYTNPGNLDLKAESADIARPSYATSTPFMYKYNGKEFQDELGLNMYDMDMRQYDPAIARWVVLDPVIHHSMSPYNAFDNNPVFWADPSGADGISAFPDRNLDTFGTTDTMEIAQMRDGGGDPPTGGNGKKNGDPTEKKDGALAANNNRQPLKEKSGSALSKYKTNTKSKSQTKSKTQEKSKLSSSNSKNKVFTSTKGANVEKTTIPLYPIIKVSESVETVTGEAGIVNGHISTSIDGSISTEVQLNLGDATIGLGTDGFSLNYMGAENGVGVSYNVLDIKISTHTNLGDNTTQSQNVIIGPYGQAAIALGIVFAPQLAPVAGTLAPH